MSAESAVTNPHAPATEAASASSGSDTASRSLAGCQLPVSRIALTGFMAAGKTTVGRLLASRLCLPFADVDEHIEQTVGMTVPEIFLNHGEPGFRELEHQAIARLLSAGSLVLAMGGGAIEDDRTRTLLLTSANLRLVYLDASFETALERCGPAETSSRPVLADRVNLRARYQKRLPLYRQSHHTIAVDNLTPEQVADAVLRALQAVPEPD